MKIAMPLALVAGFSLALSGTCFADGFKDCTKLEKAKWKPASEAEAKASAAG